MKIYEFENLLDNGITTFEFKITKKVDYFFNEKEIDNIRNDLLTGKLKINNAKLKS